MEYYLKEPAKIYDFDKLNKKEAKEYFDWYISQIPERIQVIKDYFKSLGKDINFDYSQDSLISVWSAFEEIIELRSEEEKKKILEEDSLAGTYATFTSKTLGIAIDIGMYFGEAFRINNTEVYWGYFTKPKNRIGVNAPTLLGFIKDMDLSTERTVCTGCWRSLKSKDKNFLYDTYEVWKKYIIKN